MVVLKTVELRFGSIQRLSNLQLSHPVLNNNNGVKNTIMMKKWICYVLSLCTLLLVGCSENKTQGASDGWKWNAKSVVVTPTVADVPIGFTQQMEADAVLNDGTTVRVTRHASLAWSSSNPNVAMVNETGLVQGQSAGEVTITARATNPDGSRVVGTATLVISNSVPQSLIVTPKSHTVAKGVPFLYKAEAKMSDGRVLEVTRHAQLTWSSSKTDVASISNEGEDKGVVKGLKEGVTQIQATAKVNGVTLSDTAALTVKAATMASLVVKPTNSTLAVGQERQFQADAVMTDGMATDVTSQVSWSSSQPGVALVSNDAGTKGRVQGRAISANPVAISASLTVEGDSYQASGQLRVVDAAVTGLSLTTKYDAPSLAKGLSAKLIALASLSDGSVSDVTQHSDVSWTSSDTNVVSVSNSPDTKGQVTGLKEGEATVTVTGNVAGQRYQDSLKVKVSQAVVTSVEVTPVTASTPVGLSQPFKAMAMLSDGSAPVDVTDSPFVSWSSDEPSVATVSNSAGSRGRATGVATGQTLIVATLNTAGIVTQGSATLEVTSPVMTGLQVTLRRRRCLMD